MREPAPGTVAASDRALLLAGVLLIALALLCAGALPAARGLRPVRSGADAPTAVSR